MVVNHLFVVPSDNTLAYLEQQTSGCPFTIDLSKVFVTVAFTTAAIEPDSSQIYLAEMGNLSLFPNLNLGGSSLILPLVSNSLQQANFDISETEGDAFDILYSPHLTLVETMPPNRRYIKSWINSLSGIFKADGRPLEFGNETVESIELSSPLDEGYLNYQQAMVQHIQSMAR